MNPIRKITPEICVNIQLRFVKKSQLQALLKSLKADNVDFPNGLSMKMLTSRDNTMVIRLSSRCSVGTLVNTLDELLEHISIGSKVISNA